MQVSEQAVWAVPRGGVVFAAIVAVMVYSFDPEYAFFALALGIALTGVLLRIVLHVLDERNVEIETYMNGAWDLEDPGDGYATNFSEGMILIGIVLVVITGLIAGAIALYHG